MVFLNWSAGSPTMVMPMPRKMAKTIICSISAFSIDSIGLVGKILTITLIMGGASLAAAATPSAGRFIPAPGWIILPKIRPRTMANAVVIK